MELACVRDILFCYFLVIENYYSLVDLFWKTEVIGELHLVRSADENVGGSVIVIYSGYRKQLASRTTCGPPTKTCVGGCLFCSVSGNQYTFLLWVTEVGRPELGGKS